MSLNGPDLLCQVRVRQVLGLGRKVFGPGRKVFGPGLVNIIDRHS